jgi:uncharacterized protein (UPF0210 family)
MKIRSITYFCNPKYPLDAGMIHFAGAFLEQAKAAFDAAGYEVQTRRLATRPFPQMLAEKQLNQLPRLAAELDLLMPQVGIGYGSLGPALPTSPRSYEVIPESVAASKNVFFDGIMADKARGLDLAAVRRCAEIIVKCSAIDPNGFANLRFAALANVKPGSPFFPAAYHDSNLPAFALATEAADLAVDAFSTAKTVKEARTSLVAEIERHAKALAKVAQGLVRHNSGASKSNARDPKPPSFRGIDFSLAPFPAQASSIGTAFQRLGVSQVGLHGSLAAAAILTECLDRARFRRTGVNGLMLPVLEDYELARRAEQGTLTVKDLLLFSAVCGTGLDTIPLPGNASAEQITPLLVDVATLALRLDKPLTARLMPIPNKQAGDVTGFDFAYFANSKVMALDSGQLHGPLGGDETFSIRPRH